MEKFEINGRVVSGIALLTTFCIFLLFVSVDSVGENVDATVNVIENCTLRNGNYSVGNPYWVIVNPCSSNESRQNLEYRTYTWSGTECVYTSVPNGYGVLQFINGDNDNDGVCNNVDRCLYTTKEKIPYITFRYIGPNGRYADIDTDKIFETKYGGKILDSKYTLNSTYGCNCWEILLANKKFSVSELAYGCTQTTIENWINHPIF